MWVLFLGCLAPKTRALAEGSAQATPEMGLAAASLESPDLRPSESVSIGEPGWSFVYGSTLSGRTVFLVEFGEERPSFGHHGEPFGAEPTLRAWDSVSGESSVIEDLIAVSGDRRHALVQDVGGIWLIDDAGAWRQLEGVTLEPDNNRCLPPRQAAFSVDGSSVGWINPEHSALEVLDLESGEQWSVAAQGSLWRGWPDNDGRGVSLIELQGDGQEGTAWPQQKTSCACRWCGMFALSYGVYGWSGPEFELVHVDGEGERGEALEEGGGGPWHGPNAQGCILESASPIEDPLQHGPWTWVCKD